MMAFVIALVSLHVPSAVKCQTTETSAGKYESCLFTNDSTGILESKGNFLNGKTHGKQEHWYPSGKLKSVSHYRNDLEIDTSVDYHESGKLSGLTICDSLGDSCTWTSYLPDGRVCGGGQSKKGVSVGRSWSKYADGKWQHITERDEEGRYHGARVRWDSLGRLIDSVVYFRDEILREWNWYPESNQLEHRCVWDSTDQVTHKAKPRLMEAAFFAPDGKSRGSVVGGNGILRYYYEGKLSGTEAYKGGVMVRSTLKYLEDGSLNPLYAKKKKR